MELKSYWYIIWKRIWVPILLVLLVGGISWANQETPPPVYTATMRFIVSVQPERLPDEFNYDGYYAGVSSEYIADDFAVVVGSYAFAADVNRHLQALGSGINITPGVIQGLLAAEKQHRILTLTLTWPNPEELTIIGEAITQALKEDGAKYLTQLNTFGGVITIIDPPSTPAPVPPSLTQEFDMPMRMFLALGAGIALTFLLDFWDDRIQKREELEALGLPVLAELLQQKG